MINLVGGIQNLIDIVIGYKRVGVRIQFWGFCRKYQGVFFEWIRIEMYIRNKLNRSNVQEFKEVGSYFWGCFFVGSKVIG